MTLTLVMIDPTNHLDDWKLYATNGEAVRWLRHNIGRGVIQDA